MTIAVDMGRKATKKQKTNHLTEMVLLSNFQLHYLIWGPKLHSDNQLNYFLVLIQNIRCGYSKEQSHGSIDPLTERRLLWLLDTLATYCLPQYLAHPQ